MRSLYSKSFDNQLQGLKINGSTLDLCFATLTQDAWMET
jgi:hypothetical protein